MRDAAVVVSQSTDRSGVEDGPTEETESVTGIEKYEVWH